MRQLDFVIGALCLVVPALFLLPSQGPVLWIRKLLSRQSSETSDPEPFVSYRLPSVAHDLALPDIAPSRYQSPSEIDLASFQEEVAEKMLSEYVQWAIQRGLGLRPGEHGPLLNAFMIDAGVVEEIIAQLVREPVKVRRQALSRLLDELRASRAGA